MTLKYTPDQDIKVHEEGAIRLICAPFQSHENGLPEWLKNSSDAYMKSNIALDRRAIVVAIQTGRGGQVPTIACLDFVGMTSKTIESDFRMWADPDAASRGTSGLTLQGGHGNGGKCYMTQMFEGGAYLLTVRAGKGCRYGVAEKSVKFGYSPDAKEGRDFIVADVKVALNEALRSVGIKAENLPESVRACALGATSFTLVAGLKPKGYGDKPPIAALVQALEEHQEMLKTLESCAVHVMVDGVPFEAGRRLVLPPIVPLPGGAEPRVIPIPSRLPEPHTGVRVDTHKPGATPGRLVLLTSSTSMRWSKKHRHTIIYEASGASVGRVPITSLDVASSYRDRIYGRCFLDATADLSQNDRGALAPSPLRDALEHWIAQQVQIYAKEFEAKDKQRYSQEEKTALSKMNEALDHWKNGLLKDMLKDLWGQGGGLEIPRRRLPSGKVKRIEVQLSHDKAGLGVAFRPTIHFFNAEGKEVRGIPFRWQSDNNNVAMVDDDLGVITTFAYGTTSLWAEAIEGKLKSNRVPLEVLRITAIRLEPTDLEIDAGSRKRVEAICKTSTAEFRDDVYLVWTEGDPGIARVSASGQVFAFTPGTTEVTAGDDKVQAATPVRLKVVEAPPKGRGGTGKTGAGGGGFPLILVSGIDTDPETGETIAFSREDPPVSQRPRDVDRNIYWINSSAPFAALYLDADKNYGYKSREWRIYHLERYVDVLVQIALTHAPESKGNIAVDEWTMRSGLMAAQIQAAAVSSLRGFIDEGLLPEGT